ncbi:MAG: phospholipid carrier-dependent glycosyltransferase [bacterium]|nr:phospholipid carrier-dependent glycosyltransferase [bacterium]
MKFLKRIFSDTECLSLFLILTFFSLLRLPSLFEPNWYGDEGIYQVLGHAMREGRILYSGIWDNKPPLLYLTYALVGIDQFWIRFFSYLAGLLAVYACFLLSKRLFTDRRSGLLTTGLFAFLFSIPATEANIANAENFMLVFLLFAAYFVYGTNPTKDIWKQRTLFLGGILVSVAALYKIVAVFDFAAFFLFLAILSLPKKLTLQKEAILTAGKPALLFATGCIVPILLTTAYFFSVGALQPFLQATFTNNVSYVGYKNYFLFPQGLLIAKLFILAGFTLFLCWKRTSLPKNALFILLWFAFSLFNVFFSQRPYTHYVLVAIASSSLLVGLIASEKKYRRITLPLLGAGALAISMTFGPIKPARVYGYYINFIQYVAGYKTTRDYQRFFDSDVPRDYEIAEFINAHLENNKNRIIFIWGNTAQIYTLSNTLPPGRYTVAYHIASENALSETQLAIDNKKPSFIILLPDSPTPQLLLTAYTFKATIGNASIYERTR